MFNQIVTVLCFSTTLTRSFNLPNMTAETTTYRCSNHEISCLECCTIFPGSIHNNVCFFTKIASSETIKLKTLQYIFFFLKIFKSLKKSLQITCQSWNPFYFWHQLSLFVSYKILYRVSILVILLWSKIREIMMMERKYTHN